MAPPNRSIVRRFLQGSAIACVAAVLSAIPGATRQAANASLQTAADDGVHCLERWSPPVSAAVVDHFRPPSNPFGPGNRGLEYATATGDPVTAVDRGVVSFAGPVGGSLFVVVSHGPELKSTYGYLSRINIARGQTVGRGDSLATAEVGFHLTARRNGNYIDPMPLLAGECFVIRLIPLPE